MQHSQQVIEKYKESFKKVNDRIDFYEVDKHWYKQKFQFRISMDTYVTHKNKMSIWTLKSLIEKHGKCRCRIEGNLNIFTSDLSLLDFLLSKEEIYSYIQNVTTTSSDYLEELNKIGNIAVDVKFLNPKKMTNGYKYEIEFNEWKMVDPFSVNFRHARSNALVEIIDFCKKNKDDLEAYPRLLEWYDIHKKEKRRAQHGFFPTSYYGKVSVYVKNEDIILQIVMLYQEKIKNIYKLIERVKH